MKAFSPDISVRFAARMAQLVPERPVRLGLAVSGGSDSMALMTLAQAWAGDTTSLHVATVDHHLRPGSAQEAQTVATAAKRLGLSHDTLHWQGWRGRGNLQDAARQARRGLLAQWAIGLGLDAVLLGHTQEDQAETFLLRLARGSGVDGLAGMQEHHRADGIVWLRPMLDLSRTDLRAWLATNQIDWTDDPSNDDPAFDRVRARQMQGLLASLGLTSERLAETAARMATARVVLDMAADAAQTRLRRAQHGDIAFDAAGLDALPEDLRTRLVARALCEVASKPYRPRLKALRASLTASRATLHGCVITRNKGELRITREASAVRGLRVPLGQVWDNRWRLIPPEGMPTDTAQIRLSIAALGPDGLARCPDRSHWRLPRQSLLASPGVWRDSTLVAAPLAGLAPDWHCKLCQSDTLAASGPYSH